MKINIPDPLVTYSWYEIDREYKPIEGSKIPTYKWTRHFLVEKSAPAGSGEWICEGDIPEPVVFMLQLYRHYKLNKPKTSSTAELPDININNSPVDKTPTKSSNESVESALSKQRPDQTPKSPTETGIHGEAVAMFAKYAESKSAQIIDFPSFVKLMCEVKPGLSETEVKLAFELIDSNKDSLIDVNEFGDWFSELKEWGNEME